MTLDDKIRFIIEGGEYISWLDEFSEKNSFFNSFDIKEYSDEEKYFISNLRYLYYGLKRRLHNNYYDETDYGGYYKIKFNGNGYFIGVDEDEDPVFYCKRVEIYDDSEFIDYYEVENHNTKIVRVRNVGVKTYA